MATGPDRFALSSVNKRGTPGLPHKVIANKDAPTMAKTPSTQLPVRRDGGT
jgi:hypothetical protein